MKNINYFRNLKINALVVFISIIISSINGQVSGTVFRDFNGNGIRDTWNSVLEPAIGNVTIKAYNTSGNEVGSVTSGPTNGSYSFSALSGMIRLELELPGMEYDGAFGTGNGNKSTIRFVNASTNPSNVNFALSSPDEYFVSTDPKVFTIRYCNGNMNTGTISGNTDIVLAFNYSDTGRPASQGGSAPEPQHIASGSSVGSVWGTAYSKQSNKLFVSSFLKRHVGMGPGGSGAIYMLDVASPPAAGTVPPYASLDAMGFPTQGSGSYSATPIGFHPVIGTNAQRGLPDGGPVPSADASAFGQVGKVSLGDLDISTDGKYLFSINLYDRKIYRIDLGNPNNPTISNSSTVKTYSSLPWFSLDNSNGKARPFALRYYKGNIYVGVVTTEENSTYPGNSSLKRYPGAMRAYIYKIDPESNGSGTIVLEFPLNYTKETAGGGDGAVEHGWYIWSDNFNDYFNPGYVSWSGEYPGHNSPILSDIEFDSEGSMMLAFMDRSGHQWGIANVDPLGQNSQTVIAGGDILRTYYDKLTDTYTLEANGIAGPYNSNSVNGTSGTVDVNTGPGTPNGIGASFTGYTTVGREFFYMDCALIFGSTYPNPHHNEGINGGLALFGPSGQVMCSGLDPDDCCAYSGGVYKLSTTDGSRTNGYNLFTSAGPGNAGGFLGKANGMGDVEVLNDVPPLEIGNLVWNDANSNGIQDAGEAGISGVSVQLYNAAGTTLISTATTDANGNYIFSSGTGTSTAAFKYGITQLIPNTNYIIRVPTSTGGLNLTTANAGSKNTIDSDAPSSGDVPVLASEIPMAGANNHTFDIGYSPLTCSLTSAGKTNETCNNNGTPSVSTDDYITFSLNPTGTGLGSGYTVTASGGATVTPTSGTYGSATNFRLQNGSANGTTYTITVTDNATGACQVTTTVMKTSCSTCPTSCFYTTSWYDGLVLKYDGELGTPSGSFGQPYINYAYDAEIGPDGMLYVASQYGDKIIKFNPATGAHLGDFVTAGSGGLDEPTGLTFGPDGNLYVSGTLSAAVHKYNGTTGASMGKFVDNTPAGVRPWQGIEFGPDGNLYVANENLSVEKYNGTTGAYMLTFAPTPGGHLQDLTFGPDGNLYLVEQGNNRVTKWNPATGAKISNFISTPGASTNTLTGASFGPDGNFYLAHWEPTGGISKYDGTTGAYIGEFIAVERPKEVLFVCGTCSEICSLTSAGKSNEACNSNNTQAITTDDYITFSLNPTGTGLGSGYTVTASGGTTVTPATGTYGSATNFQLQNGSANGTTYTITVTDNVNATCTATTTVNEAACSVCGIAATTAPDCNNNNTMAIKTDDYFTVIVNGTTTTPGTSNKYIIVYNGTTLNPGGTTYGTQFTIGTNKIFSANGASTYILLIKDFDDPTCYVSKTVGPVANCSECPVPDCLNVQMKKN